MLAESLQEAGCKLEPACQLEAECLEPACQLEAVVAALVQIEALVAALGVLLQVASVSVVQLQVVHLQVSVVQLHLAVVVGAAERHLRQLVHPRRKSCCRLQCTCRLEGSPAHIALEGK